MIERSIQVAEQTVEFVRIASASKAKRVTRHVTEEHVRQQLRVIGQVLVQDRSQAGMPSGQPANELGRGAWCVRHAATVPALASFRDTGPSERPRR